MIESTLSVMRFALFSTSSPKLGSIDGRTFLKRQIVRGSKRDYITCGIGMSESALTESENAYILLTNGLKVLHGPVIWGISATCNPTEEKAGRHRFGKFGPAR